MITAITPTGDRPLAFFLCQQWMKHQTRRPDQWIVVDDGEKPMKDMNGFEYVRRKPKTTDSKFTLVENLLAAIPYIKHDKIIIIEDDEYYASRYIETMANRLSKHEVVGIGKSRYYHLPSGGYFTIGNMGHASLAQTGFKKSFIPVFRQLLIPGKLYIDFMLWKKAKARKRGFIFVDKTPLYVGMKGLPGRKGIGRGHDRNLYRKFDTGRRILKKWIPKDYQIYLDILK